MNSFSKKINCCIGWSLEGLNKMSLEWYGQMKVESYFFGGNYPGSLLDGDFIIASQNQIEYHRERKEREKKR